jgi:hypothetical protein
MKNFLLPFFLLPFAFIQAQTSAQDDLTSLRWKLRDALKMQLPLTYQDMKDGQYFEKSYSFDVEATADGKEQWVIPEKLHEPETDKLVTAGKYLLDPVGIDPASIQKLLSEDGSLIGIVIRAKQGVQFVYDPFGAKPDEKLNAIYLGWWDHVQDRTVDRVVTLIQQTLVKTLNP